MYVSTGLPVVLTLESCVISLINANHSILVGSLNQRGWESQNVLCDGEVTT